VVEVHYSEGVAIRADLESCAVIREDHDEALTEECTGQPLSRERLIPDADTVTYVEGDTQRCAIASAACDPAWSKTLACVEGPLLGNREILGLAGEHPRPVSGRQRAVADDERSQEV